MEKRGNGTIEHDTVPLVGRERNTLSVTDRCLGRGGDGTIMRFGAAEWVVNIAHSWKLCIGVNYRRGRNASGYWTLIQLEVADATLLFRYQRRS
jgi:hypothetical protein